MAIYILMFAITTILLAIEEKINNKIIKRILTICAILLPAIIAGNRHESRGTDISVYGKVMWYIASSGGAVSFFNLFGFSDILFSTFTIIISIVFKNFQVYLFFMQLVNCWLAYKACVKMKKSCPIWLSFLIYLVFVYFRQLNILRQGMAISFILYAFACVLNNEKKKYYFYTIIASFFHISAAIFLVIPLLQSFSKSKKNKFAIIYIYSLLIIIIFFFEPILQIITSSNILPSKYSFEYFKPFLNVNHELDNLGTFYCILGIGVMTIPLFNKKILDKFEEFMLGFNLLFLGTLLYLTHLHFMYFERISYYFLYSFAIFYIPQMRNILKNNFVNRLFFYSITIVIIAVYWYVRIVYQNSGELYPYIHF